MARADAADASRAAIFAHLGRQADPNGVLAPDERDRLVRSAARALAARLNSAKARKRSRRRAGQPAKQAIHECGRAR
jgi:hypothetical protein